MPNLPAFGGGGTQGGKEQGPLPPGHVIASETVMTDEGTGILHVAPAFGANDYALGRKHGLMFLQPVSVAGTVIGGPGDGRIATWLLPPWAQQDDGFNTPHVSLVVNDVAQELGFGDHRFDAADYGAEDWRDLEGALGSQQCVEDPTA